MIHEVPLLLVWVRRHGKVLLLASVDWLREGGGGGRVESRVTGISLVLVVELKVQAQAAVVVHDAGWPKQCRLGGEEGGGW